MTGNTATEREKDQSEAKDILINSAESFASTGAGCAIGGTVAGVYTAGAGTVAGCATGSTITGNIYSFFNQKESNWQDALKVTLGGDKNADLPQIIGFQAGQFSSNFLGAKAINRLAPKLKSTNPIDDAQKIGQSITNQNKAKTGIEICAQESIEVEGAKTCGFKIDGQESTPEKKQEIIKHGGEFVIESLDRNGKVIVVRQDIEFVTLRDTEEFISKKLEVNIREKLNWNQPQKFEIEGVEFEPLQDNSGQAYSFGGKGFTDGEIRLHPQGHSEQPQDLNSMKNHVNLEYTKDGIRYRSHLVYKQ